MLILNLILAAAIVIAILSLLGWGIVADRARVAWIHRHHSDRARSEARRREPLGGSS